MASSPAASAVAGVNYADPTAVGAAYITARWTYNAAVPGSYSAAQSATALTTPTFAAASLPSGGAIARAETAQETSTATVTSSALAAEAPQSTRAAYVIVAFTATLTYAGAGSGTPAAHQWSLRLLNTAPQGQLAHWLVDGVVISDN